MRSNYYTALYQHLTKSKGVDIMEINAIQLRLASSYSQVKRNTYKSHFSYIY